MEISPVCQRDDPIKITVKWVDNSQPSIPVGHRPNRYELVTIVLFKPRFRISFIHKLMIKMWIMLDSSFLRSITPITNTFPNIPRSSATSIMLAPRYIAMCEGPTDSRVVFVWFIDIFTVTKSLVSMVVCKSNVSILFISNLISRFKDNYPWIQIWCLVITPCSGKFVCSNPPYTTVIHPQLSEGILIPNSIYWSFYSNIEDNWSLFHIET